MRRLLGLALALLAGSCALQDAPPSVEGVAFQNARYQVTQEVRAAGGDAASLLRVRMQPGAGWHFADEAPVGLRLGSLPGYQFDAAEQRSGDALERSEQAIAFESGFRVAGGAKGGALPARVKFGLCRDGDTRCEIIEREIELTLPPQP